MRRSCMMTLIPSYRSTRKRDRRGLSLFIDCKSAIDDHRYSIAKIPRRFSCYGGGEWFSRLQKRKREAFVIWEWDANGNRAAYRSDATRRSRTVTVDWASSRLAETLGRSTARPLGRSAQLWRADVVPLPTQPTCWETPTNSHWKHDHDHDHQHQHQCRFLLCTILCTPQSLPCCTINAYVSLFSPIYLSSYPSYSPYPDLSAVYQLFKIFLDPGSIKKSCSITRMRKIDQML